MSDMDTSSAKRRHKRWPEALKREIVAATFFPGASVSVVARQYDVNANQVFSWRRRYREAEPPPSTSSTPGLVPVTITPGPEDKAASTPAPTASETIEIDVSGTYRVRVRNGFDGQALRRVLDVLRRR
jgi:transposase